jgi:hypothetical protein
VARSRGRWSRDGPRHRLRSSRLSRSRSGSNARSCPDRCLPWRRKVRERCRLPPQPGCPLCGGVYLFAGTCGRVPGANAKLPAPCVSPRPLPLGRGRLRQGTRRRKREAPLAPCVPFTPPGGDGEIWLEGVFRFGADRLHPVQGAEGVCVVAVGGIRGCLQYPSQFDASVGERVSRRCRFVACGFGTAVGRGQGSGRADRSCAPSRLTDADLRHSGGPRKYVVASKGGSVRKKKYFFALQFRWPVGAGIDHIGAPTRTGCSTPPSSERHRFGRQARTVRS